MEPSGFALWVSRTHQMGKFVPMIDWQVFQIRAVLGMECWLAAMRQSGLSPWSRQQMRRNNLTVRPAEDEMTFRGQEVFSPASIDTSSSQMNTEPFCFFHTITSICFIDERTYLLQLDKIIDEARRPNGSTPDILLSPLKSSLVLHTWINCNQKTKFEELHVLPCIWWLYWEFC